MAEAPTDYEKQRNAIVSNRHGGSTAEPTPLEFVMFALHMDPEQDGLYLCSKCGITWDHECGYGGWHSSEQALDVRTKESDDDSESLDTFMLGVLARRHHEVHYGENRPDYLLALAWVLDNWRAEDDPIRRRLALIAEAISTASAEDSANGRGSDG